MPHTIVYNVATHVAEITAHGEVTSREVQELYAEARQLVTERKCLLFLSDYRDATVKLSTAEIFDLPGDLSDALVSSGVSAQSLKRALVVASDLKDFLFFEDVTYNQGHNTKVFDGIDDARAWLLGL